MATAALPLLTFDPVDPGLPSVTAAFDPDSLAIVKPVAWVRAASATADAAQLEFSRAQGRQLSARTGLAVGSRCGQVTWRTAAIRLARFYAGQSAPCPVSNFVKRAALFF